MKTWATICENINQKEKKTDMHLQQKYQIKPKLNKTN